MKRDLTAYYFGILRNYGLATEPGNFGYFYISLTAFITYHLVNNINLFTINKFICIFISFILTFSAGAFGILLVVLFLLIASNIKKYYKIGLPIILIFSILGFILLSALPPDFLNPIIGKLLLSSDYASSSSRSDAYTFGLSALNEFPLFGNGSSYIEAFYEHSLYNWFLTITVEYGFVTVFFILLFFSSVLLRISNNKNVNKFSLLLLLLQCIYQYPYLLAKLGNCF